VERSPDSDHVKAPDVLRQILCPALDQHDFLPGSLDRLSRGLQHAWLRIDRDNTSDVLRKPESQQGRPGA
jgi:hypothetical protein